MHGQILCKDHSCHMELTFTLQTTVLMLWAEPPKEATVEPIIVRGMIESRFTSRFFAIYFLRPR